MFAMKVQQTALPLASDWCTLAYAAELVGVDQRTVRRAITAGKITCAPIRYGKRETGRRHLILSVAEVTEFAAAYKRIHATPTEVRGVAGPGQLP